MGRVRPQFRAARLSPSECVGGDEPGAALWRGEGRGDTRAQRYHSRQMARQRLHLHARVHQTLHLTRVLRRDLCAEVLRPLPDPVRMPVRPLNCPHTHLWSDVLFSHSLPSTT